MSVSKGAGSPTRMQGRRAGANAPPTPCRRLTWPPALKTRLEKAGIETKPKFRCR